jgi:uncharacterized protein (TIGR02118 family)
MIVFTVLYPNEPGKHFDMDYYCDKHIGMVKEKLGDALKGVSVERGLPGPAPDSESEFAVVCRLQFASLDDFQNCVVPHSPAFDADVPNFTDITPRFEIHELVI